jgi:hypothetical protein
MKKLLLTILVSLMPVFALADGVTSYTARRFVKFNGAPTICQEGDVYYNLTSHTSWVCNAANTWIQTGPAAITATTCTNQFVRSIATSGAATCNTVGTSDLATSLSLTTPTLVVPVISGNTTYGLSAFLITNSSLAVQDTGTNTRTVVRVLPHGTVANSPAVFEFYGTDLSADAVNYERLSVTTKGSGDSAYVISTSAGGSGTVRDLQITTGANSGLTLTATTGAGSYGGALSITGALTPSQTNGIVGTTTNNNANTGALGEYITGTVAPTTTALTTNTSVNVGANTNISLTAGDWDCYGVVNFTFGATTSVTNLSGGVSTTTGTLPAQDSFFDYETAANVMTSTKVAAYVCPTIRLSIASTTNVFLVTQATFTLSTASAGGTIRCRRAR